MEDKDIELKVMDLLEKVAQFGYAMSNKVGKEEFIQMINEGATDQQQAAHEIMMLIQQDRKERDERRKAEDTKVLEGRDKAEDWADILAIDIERLTGKPVGEHSNVNDPWQNAHKAVCELEQSIKQND